MPLKALSDRKKFPNSVEGESRSPDNLLVSMNQLYDIGEIISIYMKYFHCTHHIFQMLYTPRTTSGTLTVTLSAGNMFLSWFYYIGDIPTTTATR